MSPAGEFLIGAAGFLAFKALDKAILEPIAANAGRKLVARYLPEALELLDLCLDAFGLEFDPEDLVRDYLDQQSDTLSEEEIQQVVEAVFAAWDLRVAASS